jgi:hypothetical protein
MQRIIIELTKPEDQSCQGCKVILVYGNHLIPLECSKADIMLEANNRKRLVVELSGEIEVIQK